MNYERRSAATHDLIESSCEPGQRLVPVQIGQLQIDSPVKAALLWAAPRFPRANTRDHELLVMLVWSRLLDHRKTGPLARLPGR